jgi:hypothetical protein
MPFLILVAVLYGLLLLATPFLAIGLYVRHAKLRKQLNDFTEENAKNLTKLQRAVGELQSKLAATTPHVAATPATEKPVTPQARQPVAVPRSFPQAYVPPPVAVPSRVEVQPPPKPQAPPLIPVTEKKPEPALEQKPQVPTPVVPVPPAAVPPVTATPPTIPAAAPPLKPPVPPAPVEPKPLAPAAQAPPPEAKPNFSRRQREHRLRIVCRRVPRDRPRHDCAEDGMVRTRSVRHPLQLPQSSLLALQNPWP